MKVVRLRNQLSQHPTKRQKFFRVFLTGLFGLAFLILIPIAVIQNFMPERGMELLGFRLFLTADTRSMEPLLSYNDLLIVIPYDFASLDIGDIVTFKSKRMTGGVIYEKYITHQIVDHATDDDGNFTGFITRGVNPLVGLDQVYLTEFGENGTNAFIGLMHASNRPLGRALAFIISPVGLGLIAINTFFLIAVNVYIRKLRFDDQRDYEIKQELNHLQRQLTTLQNSL